MFHKLKKIIQLLKSVHIPKTKLNKAIADLNSKNLELEQFAFIASLVIKVSLFIVHNFKDKLRNNSNHLQSEGIRIYFTKTTHLIFAQ